MEKSSTKTCRVCTLSVKIKNAEPNAYQHEIYGDAIIVERQFSRTGSSGFKLKSANKRVISTRKGDLDDLCDYFALSLDNPMSVLTQDNARQFLNSSTPHDKYSFFSKGTQLEQLSQDYQLVEESIDSVEIMYYDKRKDMEALKADMARKKELKQICSRADGLREAIARVRRQMAWVQVEEQEQLGTSYEGKIREDEIAIEKHQRSTIETSAKFERAQEAYTKSQQVVEAVEKVKQDFEGAKRLQKEIFDAVKQETVEAKVDTHSISSVIVNFERTGASKADS